MKLDLYYNEMSFLRELVIKKRADLVRSYLPSKPTQEQIDKIEGMMFYEPQYSDGGYDYPCLNEPQICARLLRKFQEIEDDCRAALSLTSNQVSSK